MKSLFIFCLFLFFVSCEVELDGHVLVGTSLNLDEILKNNEHVLVEFYAPWCGHCKHLAPEYEKAAKQLADESSPIKLVKVDATVHTELQQQYDVKGYPTLYFFKNGAKVSYEGDRTAAGIVGWVKKKSGPASQLLKSEDEVKTFSPNENFVLGVFKNDKSEAYATFLSVATTTDDFKFAHRFADGEESISLEGTKSLKYSGAIDKDAIVAFIESEGYPTLVELDQKVWKRSVMSKKSLLVGFIKGPEETGHQEQLDEVQKLADSLKGKVLVSWMDGTKNENLINRWGGSGKVVPTSIFVYFPEGSTDPKFGIWNEDDEKEFNVQTLTKFYQGTLEGTYVGYKKSEPVPENNNGPVKIVVGKNFEEIVFDKTKDVLLEFYAPWCGHCQKLAPIYDQLGTAFESNKNIVIAKIDATANSYPDSIAIRGFPTLLFFSKNDKQNPVSFEGERSLEDLKKFVNEKATVGHEDL